MLEDREGGDAARTEPPHRADGGDASPPLVIRGERYFQGKDNDTGERSFLIPFAGRSPRSARLQARPSARSRSPCAQRDHGLAELYVSDGDRQRRCAGDHLCRRGHSRTEGYARNGTTRRHAPLRARNRPWRESRAVVCYGGNRDTCLVSLSGDACSLVQDWKRVVALGQDRFQGRITRWDGAVDDYLGVSAGVILIHFVGVELTHLGEDGGLLAAADVTQEQAVEIRVLRRRGLGLRAIARELGCSRTTVKRYVRDEAAARYGPRQPRPT
jgi:hypothetical protein